MLYVENGATVLSTWVHLADLLSSVVDPNSSCRASTFASTPSRRTRKTTTSRCGTSGSKELTIRSLLNAPCRPTKRYEACAANHRAARRLTATPPHSSAPLKRPTTSSLTFVVLLHLSSPPSPPSSPLSPLLSPVHSNTHSSPDSTTCSSYKVTSSLPSLFSNRCEQKACTENGKSEVERE